MTDEATLRAITQRIREGYPAGDRGHDMAVEDILGREWALCDKEAACAMLDRRNVSTAMVEFGEVKEGEL